MKRTSFKHASKKSLKIMAARFRDFREYIERSQQQLCDDLKTPQNFIHRIEMDCKVSLPGFWAYIEYLELIHNLNRFWLLTPDNTGIPIFMSTVDKRKKVGMGRQAEALEELRKFIKIASRLLDDTMDPNS